MQAHFSALDVLRSSPGDRVFSCREYLVQSLPKQLHMRPRPHEDNRIGLLVQAVDQQEVAADVAFAVAGPFALGGVITPLRPERGVVRHQQQHDLLKWSCRRGPSGLGFGLAKKEAGPRIRSGVTETG